MSTKIDETSYFAPQVSKSDRKIAVQYRRMFTFGGLAKRLPAGPVLDVGCGAGPGLRYIRSRGATAIGADPSIYALREAAKLIQVDLVQMDAAPRFPFADQTFGMVLANEVIEHVPDGVEFLLECARVLKPSGMVFLTTPNLWDIRRVLAPLVGKVWSGDTDPTHINLYTPWRLRQDLKTAGFQQPRIKTGFKPIRWLPPHRNPLAIPYPPLIGNGMVATGVR
ncbi:class I SAM-dependent methyltransferase [Herpetosiphon sp. NSE202]|uniref:class I SAM-dependent methyltransferase n=1 Tax=Herpetosiphon sp. NSE202 TaxID=3351349 RepID=UPI0036343C0F